MPTERTDEAKVVVADFGSPEVAAALRRGQSVIEIGGQDGKPNVELGWWFLSGIVGAVFETESPLLRHLPESKVLSPLHFRIFKQGLHLPIPGFSSADLAVVSEEGKGCFAHLGARADKRGGRHLFAYGLAVDPKLPESVAILDGLVDLARKPLSEAERAAAQSSDSTTALEKNAKGTTSGSGGSGRL